MPQSGMAEGDRLNGETNRVTTYRLSGYAGVMPNTVDSPLVLHLDAQLVKARARVLAREDRELKASLIRIRQDSGLTQRQVAELMGVTQQAVNKLERYDSDPKMSTLRRYANAVGALVHHWTTPDAGQSVLLATAPRWEDSGTSIRQMSFVVTSSKSGNRSAGVAETHGDWSGARRTDFALA